MVTSLLMDDVFLPTLQAIRASRMHEIDVQEFTFFDLHRLFKGDTFLAQNGGRW